MRQDSETNAQACEDPAMPCRDRRSLLKAAAAATPMIATLPCGAAVANSSAAQCIANDKAAHPEEVNVLGSSLPDTFLRYDAWRRNCSTPPAAPVYYYYVITLAKWYDQDGNYVPSPGCRTTTNPGGRGDVKVFVLKHWIPNTSNTNIVADDFYPVTKLNENNQGITASCYTSVAPSAAGVTSLKP
jgi:hypothetical protein